MQYRHFMRAFLVAALMTHLVVVFGHGWMVAKKGLNTRDFSSYYYALEVARAGENPYEVNALNVVQKVVRARVHPYFYPPPALLIMTWIGEDDPVKSSYLIWFWLSELALLAAAITMWRWWRPLGGEVGPVILGALALVTSIVNNHLMGQVNTVVLLFVVAGLALSDPLVGRASQKRAFIGGFLVGLAAMIKMSPALFLLWWVLHRRRWPVFGAVTAAVVSSVLTLPLVGLSDQLYFYREVLPGFGSGVYNGLTVSIGLYGNHSIPNLVDMWMPNDGVGLSLSARFVSGAIALGLLVIVGWMFRSGEGLSRWRRASQLSAIMTLLLLIPVYTYEHHLVWALPAGVLCLVALIQGELPGWMAPFVGIAWFGWAVDLSLIKGVTRALSDGPLWAVGVGLQELKFGALVIFFVSSVMISVRSDKGRKGEV